MAIVEKKVKILIVEDEIKLSKALNDKMKRQGWETAVAIDGAEGLRKVAQDVPSLILLDLRLPGMQGFEMLDQLRQKYDKKDLPVIILTNYGEQENVSRAMELKADVFLVKANYSLEEVVNKIREVLHLK